METITHDQERSRYEILVDGAVGAYAEYVVTGDPPDETITFTHTVTEPAMRGRGLAGKVVHHALDEARADHRRVVPQCSYVGHYIGEHPEYADLL